MNLRPLHASLLLVLAFTFCACSQWNAVQEEGLEAVENVQAEVLRVRTVVDEKVEQIDTVVDAVNKTASDLQEFTDKIDPKKD